MGALDIRDLSIITKGKDYLVEVALDQKIKSFHGFFYAAG